VRPVLRRVFYYLSSKNLSVLMLVLTPIILSVLPLHHVSANTSCGVTGSFFAGTNAFYTSPNYGAYSNISPADGALCTTNGFPSGTGAWVMEFGSGYHQYAQTGYIHFRNSTNQLFVEFNKGDPNPYQHLYGIGLTTTQNYGVYYYSCNSCTNQMIMQVGGSGYYAGTPWDPATVWARPWSPQWSGETHDTGDDIPGTSSNHVHFTSLCIISTNGGACNTAPTGIGLGTTGSSRYHAQWVSSPTSFDIWTNP